MDTGYIARLAVVYLEMLVEKKHDVQGRKGTYTADLRRHWGMGNLIESLADSPAWLEKNNLPPGEKNRADHRHHALDAIVIALTSRKTLAAMHQGKETVNHIDKETGEVVEHQRFTKDIPPPWGMELEEFRRMVSEKLHHVNVSHRVRRGVRGGLHEETNYGPVWDASDAGRKEQRVQGEFVVRKAVELLTMNEVENIRDETIRKLVVDRLAKHGIRPGRGAEKVKPKQMQEAMAGLCMPSGVPVRKIRIFKTDSTIQRIREKGNDPTFVRPGRNHHVCIFQWTEKGKVRREGVYVTRFEAARRVIDREPIIRESHPLRANARFVMSLCIGDMVLMRDKAGKERLLVITTLVAGEKQKRIHAASAYDARKDKNAPSITGHLLNIRKVIVDPLGRVRCADHRFQEVSMETIDPRILDIVRTGMRLRSTAVPGMQNRVLPGSDLWMRGEMKKAGLEHLGAQFSAAKRLLRAMQAT